MKDIGAACGMTHANLYNYVGSKSDILHLLCTCWSEGAKSYKQRQRKLGDMSAVDLLRYFITFHIQRCDSIREWLLFSNREIHKLSPENRRLLLSSEVDILGFFEKLLRKGTKAGEFQVSNPFLIAHNILMCGRDWAFRKWLLKQHLTLEEYIEEQTQAVLKLLGVSK
jgi:AcrR family transcriptional regulator